MTPARPGGFHLQGADINLRVVITKGDLKIPNTTPTLRVAQPWDRVVWFVLPAEPWLGHASSDDRLVAPMELVFDNLWTAALAWLRVGRPSSLLQGPPS
jgi:hypothetical protein